MKRAAHSLAPFAALALVAAPTAPTARAAGVIVDAARHAVTLTATSTDCGLDTQLEFLIVGPDSDRDYESLFVADASVREIADAFRAAGIPAGVPYDAAVCRLWPVGHALKVEPDLSTLVREMRGETTPPVVFAGGTRDAYDVPEAETNMPSAVFALYNCSQSLLQFDDALDQSPTYGRFQPAARIPKGERRAFTFTWDGAEETERVTLALTPDGAAAAIASLKDKAEKKALDVLCDFSPDMTLKEAQGAAAVLAMVDSVRVKINGAPEGQFFYRAYMPLEKWRDRRERLSQPPEVHFRPDGSITVVEVKEDWSDPDSVDPKLTPVEHRFTDAASAAAKAGSLVGRTFTMLLFAPPETRLATLYGFRRNVADAVPNWYIFSE